MTPQRRKKWFAACAATCAALGTVSAVLADIPQEAQGLPSCAPVPTYVPGLGGNPQWPQDAGAQLNTVDSGVPGWTLPPEDKRERAEVSDPRWGNSPLTGLSYTGGANQGHAPSPEDVRFRVVLDKTDSANLKLLVSVQVNKDDSGANAQDYISFGFSKVDGSNAWGVRLKPYLPGGSGGNTSMVGRYLPLNATDAVVKTFSYSSGKWANPAGTSGVPFWIDQKQFALWNAGPASLGESRQREVDANGAIWSVQFKVNVPSGLVTADGSFADQARFFVGVHVDQSFGGLDYATGNVFEGCGGACTTAPADSVAAFPVLPADWTTLSSTSGKCQGVNILPTDITAYQDTTGVLVQPNDVNTFKVKATGTLLPSTVTADLFIANWGTVADPLAGWTKLPSRLPQPQANDDKGTINFECQNGSTEVNICSVVPAANIKKDPGHHQCLQAQLRAVKTSDRIQFGNASAYTNMFYANLSETSQVAEISVKGLQGVLKNTNARDVYLHVVTHNLPLPSATKKQLNVSGLDALRAQVDRTYSNPQVTCDRPGDRCLPSDSTRGICLTPALFSDGVPFCANGSRPVKYLNGWWCVPSQQEACDLPAGGGVDPNVSSLEAPQKLRAEFPTLEVLPYYDTGKTVTVDGVTKRRLVSMPSFGMYFRHAGEFYGFLRSLVEEYGSASSPSSRLLQQVGPDLYKITVPNEGTARLRVTVASQDTPPSSFFQIVGTATPLGLWLGNATFTGVGATRPLDLSKSTVVIQKLMVSGGKELVNNFAGPVTLQRNPGALPGIATYSRSGLPSITMQIVQLPLIGQTITMQVTGANVDYPATCPLTLGTATVESAFTISDGLGSPALIQGSDTWLCFPGQLVSF